MRDLSHNDEEGEDRLCIKLMHDEDSWTRELELRSVYERTSQDVMSIRAAATLLKSVVLESSVPVEFCPGLIERVRLSSTANLMRDYPFCLVMPMADRNLAEVIQSERIAEECLDVIRQVRTRSWHVSYIDPCMFMYI